MDSSSNTKAEKSTSGLFSRATHKIAKRLGMSTSALSPRREDRDTKELYNLSLLVMAVSHQFHYLQDTAPPNIPRGFRREGIYRVPGRASDIQTTYENVIHKIDMGHGLEHLFPSDMSEYTIGSVLKAGIGKLSTEVFKPRQKWLEVATIGDRDEQKREILSLMQKLPIGNLYFLRNLFHHLLEVASYEKDNKMTIGSLSTVFGPNLFGCGGGATSTSLLDMAAGNKVVEACLRIVHESKEAEYEMFANVIDADIAKLPEQEAGIHGEWSPVSKTWQADQLQQEGYFFPQEGTSGVPFAQRADLQPNYQGSMLETKEVPPSKPILPFAEQIQEHAGTRTSAPSTSGRSLPMVSQPRSTTESKRQLPVLQSQKDQGGQAVPDKTSLAQRLRNIDNKGLLGACLLKILTQQGIAGVQSAYRSILSYRLQLQASGPSINLNPPWLESLVLSLLSAPYRLELHSTTSQRNNHSVTPTAKTTPTASTALSPYGSEDQIAHEQSQLMSPSESPSRATPTSPGRDQAIRTDSTNVRGMRNLSGLPSEELPLPELDQPQAMDRSTVHGMAQVGESVLSHSELSNHSLPAQTSPRDVPETVAMTGVSSEENMGNDITGTPEERLNEVLEADVRKYRIPPMVLRSSLVEAIVRLSQSLDEPLIPYKDQIRMYALLSSMSRSGVAYHPKGGSQFQDAERTVIGGESLYRNLTRSSQSSSYESELLENGGSAERLGSTPHGQQSTAQGTPPEVQPGMSTSARSSRRSGKRSLPPRTSQAQETPAEQAEKRVEGSLTGDISDHTRQKKSHYAQYQERSKQKSKLASVGKQDRSGEYEPWFALYLTDEQKEGMRRELGSVLKSQPRQKRTFLAILLWHLHLSFFDPGNCSIGPRSIVTLGRLLERGMLGIGNGSDIVSSISNSTGLTDVSDNRASVPLQSRSESTSTQVPKDEFPRNVPSGGAAVSNVTEQGTQDLESSRSLPPTETNEFLQLGTYEHFQGQQHMSASPVLKPYESAEDGQDDKKKKGKKGMLQKLYKSSKQFLQMSHISRKKEKPDDLGFTISSPAILSSTNASVAPFLPQSEIPLESRDIASVLPQQEVPSSLPQAEQNISSTGQLTLSDGGVAVFPSTIRSESDRAVDEARIRCEEIGAERVNLHLGIERSVKESQGRHKQSPRLLEVVSISHSELLVLYLVQIAQKQLLKEFGVAVPLPVTQSMRGLPEEIPTTSDDDLIFAESDSELNEKWLVDIS